ncbi:MAG: Tn3 family transposase [Rhodospirillales bacterium]|nr:Tn3 family transposase [Acetobacter sp.]
MASAIMLWNTMYLKRAACVPQRRNPSSDEALCKHLSPLGWEYINLTGHYA